MTLIPTLALFWSMQVFANVAFKWGSYGATGQSRRWLAGFIGGNAVGVASILFLMKIYELMPTDSNLAGTLACSGGFIGSQLILAWLFRSRLTVVQWVGIALTAIGSAMATMGHSTGG